MKIIIDIPEEEYKRVKDGKWYGNGLSDYIENGTHFPRGRGRIVDIGQIDKDKIEKDNPIICLSDRDGNYLEAVSLDYLDSLPIIIEADKKGGAE